jgi:ATP/maltotriose-dependent transcriptional regulator MalT
MLIDQGMSNKEIARHLVISEKTVENHTANLYQKLNVRSRIQAVRRAKELNLLPPPHPT